MNEIFNINDLEIAAILGSKFLHSLEEKVGEKDTFEKNLKSLSIYLKIRTLNTKFTEFLKRHNNIITVEVNKKEKAYLRDMFTRIKENKIKKEDKNFLKALLKNVLSKDNHYFIVLLCTMIKLFPSELSSGRRNSFLMGKRLSKLILELTTKFEFDDLSMLLVEEPIYLGLSKNEVTIESLKKYLIPYGYTPALFSTIHNILIENFTNRESTDIISLFNNTEITGMDDLMNFPFSDFFKPDDKTLSALTGIVSKNASRIKQQLVKKDRELDRKDIKIREETHHLLRKHLSKLQSLIDIKKRDLHPILIEIQEHITSLEKALKLHIKQVQELENTSKSLKSAIDENRVLLNIGLEELKNMFPISSPWDIEKMIKEFWHALPFLSIIEPSCEKQIIQIIRKEEKLLENKEILSPLLTGDRRKFYPDIEKIILNYKKVFKEIMEPIFIRELITELIDIWPPEIDFENPKSRIIGDQKIHLVGLNLLPRGHFYRISKKGKIEPKVDELIEKKREDMSTILRKKYSSLASTLVYDIRGSSFMSHRLRDADKEKAIRSKFQSAIFESARKGVSFILKDTGDGGILWFGANSKQLYRSIYKYSENDSNTLLRYSTALEDEFSILPHPKSAEMAIETAVNLVLTAEEFVKDNYMKYRDWFEEITEKEVFHDGITYALLPPKFKSLFRLGIGIASGQEGKDIVFTPNAFGDPDLTGILADESALFSSGRSPERSVILIDHCTLINLLLNSDEYLLTDPLNVQSDENTIVDKLLLILKSSEIENTFIFEKFTVSVAGLYYIDRKEKGECLDFNIPKKLQLSFNDKGELTSDEGRLKIIYDVIPREKDEK